MSPNRHNGEIRRHSSMERRTNSSPSSLVSTLKLSPKTNSRSVSGCETSSWDVKSEEPIPYGQGGAKSEWSRSVSAASWKFPLDMDAREVAKELKREGWYAWTSSYDGIVFRIKRVRAKAGN